ncbi:MAG: phosphoglucosamine mutase [Gemmatimonadetes bacterium]|nr:MAG: phosphoglucosamine mutase [Gemmatimonadota bacterium]
MDAPLIISASGIRGIVGRTVTPELAARYGAAFGCFVRERNPHVQDGYVLVGRDSRTSGAFLAEAAAAGLCAAGIDARLTGIGPTPTHLLAVKDDEKALGGLIVTASHNPVEWNGLKLAGPDGLFVTPAEGEQIARMFDTGPAYADWSEPGQASSYPGVVEHHIERILGIPLIAADAVRAARPHVVLDCVHGAGALVVPELLRQLGADVDGIGLTADGRFPRNPEPTPENLRDLGQRVRETGADVGFAVDPDSDRLAIVDETGQPIGEDWTLALAVDYVLGHRSGPVVTNLSSSQCIEDVAREADVPFHRSAVGEARVAALMLETGAVIGGEGNGGVMLPDLNLTRDAPLACALILSLCAERGARVGELLDGRRRYEMVKRKVPRPDIPMDHIIGTLQASLGSDAEADVTDGLRLTWPDRSEWLHVRLSGTEPILRVIAESVEHDRAEFLANTAVDCVALLEANRRTGVPE